MSNLEQINETPLDSMRRIIRDAPQDVEREFANTSNPWIACFGTRIFILETFLFSVENRKLLTDEALKITKQNLEKLKERFFELKDLHPEYFNKEGIPAEEIQRELFMLINIL